MFYEGGAKVEQLQRRNTIVKAGIKFFLRIRKKENFANEEVFEIDNHKNFEDEAQVEFRNKKFAKKW